MYKNLLYTCLFLLIMGSAQLSAQNVVPLSAVHDTTYTEFTKDDTDTYQKNFVKNESEESRDFTWFFEADIKNNWEVAVCDKVQCYFPGADGKSFSLAPEEEGEFSVHLYPRGDNSERVLTVTGMIVNSDDTDTDTFFVISEFVNTSFTSSIGDFQEQEIAINVFPNPASDYVTIASSINLGTIEIHTLTGKTVRSVHTTSSTAVIDISDLRRGLYIVHSYDVFGNRVKASKLYKK